MNSHILILAFIAQVSDANVHVANEIATLKEMVLQQATEISFLKRKVADDERFREKYTEDMDKMKKQLLLLMKVHKQQASKIASLKKDVKECESTINVLSGNHTKGPDIAMKDFRKLEKQLRRYQSSEISSLTRKFERTIKTIKGIYSEDTKELNIRMANLQKFVSAMCTRENNIDSKTNDEQGYTNNVNVLDQGDYNEDEIAKYNSSKAVTLNQRISWQRPKTRASDVNKKRTYLNQINSTKNIIRYMTISAHYSE